MSNTVARYPYRDLRSDVVAHGADLNRMNPGDRGIHEWYRFILSFPPHLVRHYLAEFGITEGMTLLDPFCGTGTTIVEMMKHAVNGVGVEANPVVALAANVKTNWNVDATRLRAEANKVAETTLALLIEQGIHDGTPSTPNVELRTLDEEQTRLLITDSISPLPLHKVLVLRDEIDKAPAEMRPALRLALAAYLPSGAGNLRFGPEVGIGKIKKDVAVVLPWLNRVDTIARDLETHQGTAHGKSRIISGDARDLAGALAPDSIYGVITSPPYPNEKDYTRTTRLESVILGYMSTRADLRAIKEGLVRSNTRTTFKADTDDQFVTGIASVQDVADRIEAERIRLEKDSGFERLYARATRLYFGGMARHLREIKPALRSGAMLAYVVGDQASYFRVMIRTGQLLAEVAEQEGYEVVRIDLFRTRAATGGNEDLREEVVILRRP